MMKIVALFMTVAVAVTASIEMPMEIQADSELGMRLLSEARELEGSEWTHTWVAGYSLKFEGCHHISQWNPEAVRFAVSRVLFGDVSPLYSCSSFSPKLVSLFSFPLDGRWRRTSHDKATCPLQALPNWLLW